MSIRAVSYGGGVQSTALLVLAARGEIDATLFLFANVGDDSEHPDTLRYVRDVAMPYASRNNIELVELRKQQASGESDSLLQRIERGSVSVPIPMRMNDSGSPGNRNCTAEFKIRVIAKELKRRGATRNDPAIVSLGISLDELSRMRTDSGIPHERLNYPLIERRLTRQDCMNLIHDEGLPIPPKSSCYFCPYHNKSAWLELLRSRPDLFAKSVQLEKSINEKRAAKGKSLVWLTDALKPLDQAITETGQLDMFAEDESGCQNAGYCMI